MHSGQNESDHNDRISRDCLGPERRTEFSLAVRRRRRSSLIGGGGRFRSAAPSTPLLRHLAI